ncbi:hypothetical protein MMC14_002277 [Varicellaria rhodocarpa]|nr:hypothetical protein [Varicellaria rhodocarpa]
MEPKISQDLSLTLTFGVELEFLLAYFPQPLAPDTILVRQENGSAEDFQERYEWVERSQQRKRFRAALLEAGLQVNPIGKTDYTKWTIHKDGSVVPTKKEIMTKVHQWADKSQTQLTEEERKTIRYVDVEIISPVFTYGTNALSEIEKAVKAITKGFPVLTPDTSGLHIHVGNSSNGFPLQTIKNLALLTHCFENQINQIHPAHRLRHGYCMLPRLAFEPEDRDPWTIAGIIDAINDKDEFLTFFGRERNGGDMPNHYRAYNFGNLGPLMSKQTIEFRQHKGTLDMAEIRNWVITTNTLVNLAHSSDSDAIADFVINYGWNTNLTLADFFSALGLGSLADFYGPRLHDHSGITIPDFFANNCALEWYEETEIESGIVGFM